MRVGLADGMTGWGEATINGRAPQPKRAGDVGTKGEDRRAVVATRQDHPPIRSTKWPALARKLAVILHRMWADASRMTRGVQVPA